MTTIGPTRDVAFISTDFEGTITGANPNAETLLPRRTSCQCSSEMSIASRPGYGHWRLPFVVTPIYIGALGAQQQRGIDVSFGRCPEERS